MAVEGGLRFGFFAAHPDTHILSLHEHNLYQWQDIHNRATGEVLRALLR
jgi:hypothetical protein